MAKWGLMNAAPDGGLTAIVIDWGESRRCLLSCVLGICPLGSRSRLLRLAETNEYGRYVGARPCSCRRLAYLALYMPAAELGQERTAYQLSDHRHARRDERRARTAASFAACRR